MCNGKNGYCFLIHFTVIISWQQYLFFIQTIGPAYKFTTALEPKTYQLQLEYIDCSTCDMSTTGWQLKRLFDQIHKAIINSFFPTIFLRIYLVGMCVMTHSWVVCSFIHVYTLYIFKRKWSRLEWAKPIFYSSLLYLNLVILTYKIILKHQL